MEIKRIAVLGTGVMGGQIAAHAANSSIEVYAFDISQEVAEKGIEAASSIKPNAFYNKKNVDLIQTFNYNDHIEKISECDWIIEAISERLDWKKDLYKKIFPHLNESAVITSNTSGISLKELSEDMEASMKKRFFITHFFNPPRYMKLVEVIHSEDTDIDTVNMMSDFLEETLGKGVVVGKDTPNFIANRIGVFGMMNVLNVSQELKLSIEDVDSLSGSLIGRPKSGTFRTADIVGLDTMAFVAKTAYEKCVNDECREMFNIPDYIQKMIDEKSLGQKSGQGFYKKIDKGVVHSLDIDTMEYTPQNKKRYTGIRFAREYTSISDRLRVLTYSDDIAGEFTWKTISKTLVYSANRLGEISDDIYSIDRAMKWGFGWSMGPFEVWDILDLSKSVKKLKADGVKVPDWICIMLDSGFTKFYDFIDGKEVYYCPNKAEYVEIPQSNFDLSFNTIKKSDNIIKKNWSASIVDIGDGVIGVEFHSVLKEDLNPIDGSIIETLEMANRYAEENSCKGIVISGDGTNFSAGANLNLILNAADRGDWESIEELTGVMQQILQGLRFSKFPVIAAPFGLVLGGGFEVIGSCDKVVAAAESYIGLVEVGVGLIPGAGGNLRMLSRLTKKINTMMPGAFPVVQKAFETIGFAKVGTSAHHSQSYGYLQKDDIIILNRAHLIKHAKDTVLKMADNYTPPEIESFKLPGASGRLAIDASVKGMVKSKKISEHDALIAKKLGYVLTGGEKGGPFSPVDEQYLLDIEREAFVSLCGEQKSIERIKYMLSKGKPLRN